MKKTSVLAILIVCLFACDKANDELLKTLKGRWQVASVSFSNASSKPDSTARPQSVFWDFSTCNQEKNGNVSQNCELAYFEGNQKLSFTYFVQAQGGSTKTVNIRAAVLPNSDLNFQRVAPFLLKSYTISQPSNDLLILTCTDCNLGLGGEIAYRATEWHLKR